MKDRVRACLEEFLIDKMKAPNVVPAAVWLASAEQHHKSAQLIINHDPAGALQMAWSAMHDIAKAAAAAVGFRLEKETHGAVVGFLACAFADALEDKDLGLIRSVQGGRNRTSYDDPRVPNTPIIGGAVNLAGRMIKIATESLLSPPDADQPDEPPA